MNMVFWWLLNKVWEVFYLFDVCIVWNIEIEKVKIFWISGCKLIGWFDVWYCFLLFYFKIISVCNNRD